MLAALFPAPATLAAAAVRTAGLLQGVTLVLACFTPIPPGWAENLAALPLVHRRFAQAQNVTIGAVIATLGLFSVLFPVQLVSGQPLARAICLATAVFWGGRLVVLPWLRAHTCCRTPWLKLGLAALCLECAIYAAGYGWLALRG